MKKFTFLPVLIAFAASVGCTQTDSAPQADQEMAAQSEVDGDGHDHAAGESTDHSVEGHAHGVGPHDGIIADWGGGKYHVEFTVDHAKQQATAYVLGSDENTPSPIDADSIELSITDPEMQVVRQAEPQAGDPEGASSRFVGTHEKLGVVQEYAGTMTGVVDGTPYSGDFEEVAHGDQAH